MTGKAGMTNKRWREGGFLVSREKNGAPFLPIVLAASFCHPISLPLREKYASYMGYGEQDEDGNGLECDPV